MAFEIEHKYLTVSDEYRQMAVRSHYISQGYLNTDPDRVVRIRIRDDEAFITVKGRNRGDIRLEFEYPVPKEDAEEMLSLCVNVISKRRYVVPFKGYYWEVDEFDGKLKGLTVAEVELNSSHTDYPLPDFVGKNITGDSRYYNSVLASEGLPSESAD